MVITPSPKGITFKKTKQQQQKNKQIENSKQKEELFAGHVVTFRDWMPG